MEQAPESDALPADRPCYRCGKNPAEGFASVWTAKDGERWYCHGDDDESPTCYEAAPTLGREAKAFVAGWFAHARNPERLVVEDAWHAFRIGDLCPACLLKPCQCPVDDSAARAIFERLSIPPGNRESR